MTIAYAFNKPSQLYAMAEYEKLRGVETKSTIRYPNKLKRNKPIICSGSLIVFRKLY